MNVFTVVVLLVTIVDMPVKRIETPHTIPYDCVH